jgi:deoxyribonuclease-1
MNSFKNLIYLVIALLVVIIVIAFKKNQYDDLASFYEFKNIGPIGNNKLTEYDESISLIKNVYNQDKKTFYCNCEYENNLKIKKDLCPFTFNDKKNEPKVVWENIVTVREISKSKYVQNDLYNFIPVVKKIKKGNLPKNLPKKFSNCSIKKNNNTHEPPDHIKGDIARTYLYMNWAYPELQLLNKKQHRLMKSWNNIDPVDQDECTRAWKILNKQKNENPFVRKIYKKKALLVLKMDLGL